MSIRSRILLFFLFAAAIYTSVVYLSTKFYVLDSFISLEQLQAKEDLDRSLGYLINEIFNLEEIVTSLAVSPSTYAFAEEKSAQYIFSHLTKSRFAYSNLSGIYIFDRQNHLVWGESYSNALGQFINDSEYYSKLESLAIYANRDQTERSGLILTEDSILITVVRSIIQSYSDSERQGVLIALRELDDEMMKGIMDTTQINFTAWKLNDQQLSDHLRHISETLIKSDRSDYVQIVGKELKHYSLIYDINQVPALLLEVKNDRAISQQGVYVMKIIILTMLGSAPVMIIFLLIVVRVILRHDVY